MGDTNQNSTKGESIWAPLKLSSLPSAAEQLVFWGIVTVGAALDLWSKSGVFNWLANKNGNEFCVIDGFFKLVTRENSGAAFSIAQGQTGFLTATSIMAGIVIIAIFLFGKVTRLVQIAMALFMAGIMGNLYDRIFNHGYVRDFIDIYFIDSGGIEHHWPAFNIADSMLCIGVGLLIVGNFTSAACQKRDPQQK